MSNLNSQFQVLAGRPPHGSSAMEGNFLQKASEDMTEGMIGKIENISGAKMSKLTSANTNAVSDYPWLVIEGSDMSDSLFTGTVLNPRLTALAIKTGVIFKVDTEISVAVGDLVYATSGLLAKITANSVTTGPQAIGQVIGVNSSAKWIIVAC